MSGTSGATSSMHKVSDDHIHGEVLILVSERGMGNNGPLTPLTPLDGKRDLLLALSIAFIPTEMMEAFEERAAIMEFDGGLSQKEAEQLAHNDIMKGKLS